ncbi:MAG: hypothetical protein NTU61_04405 [Candidatus Altiarchaeota archaeon]|nr:hypothetical protein [Candidatus Altiarchaeota archaeon]
MKVSGRKKGQASVEMVVTLGVILLVFILIGYVIFQRYSRTTDLKIYVTGQRIVNSLADNINSVNTIGDGYSMKVTLYPRMFSTLGYDIVFYRSEPTVFVHGEGFARSNILYFSSPISTSKVTCLMKECNNVCNNTESETCIKVNDTLNIMIVNYMNSIYIRPEYGLEQDNLRSEVYPFTGSDVVGDFKSIGDNVTGRRSLMYLYKDSQNRIYLVFNHNATSTVKVTFNDTIGNMSLFASYDEGELDLSRIPQGNWNPDAGDYDGGILLFNSEGNRLCIDPSIPMGTRFVWLNRGYKEIELDRYKKMCLTYP